MNLTEKTKSQEYMFKGKIINLRRDVAILPDGSEAGREVVEHNGGVCVLPLTDENEIIFVRQFRYPYMQELLEIPAGKRDSKDEDPLSCGKRELKEETGAESDNFVFLGELYPSPGYVNEVIYMYYADGLKYGESDPDDDEFLDLVKIPFEKAVEMVIGGEIKDAKTQSAILKVAHLKANNKI
ncbi:MAG: NUDIX hydrolase [Clostridia bacterium]|nr:NUDIX hydrolase [Clostridia bacterium]